MRVYETEIVKRSLLCKITTNTKVSGHTFTYVKGLFVFVLRFCCCWTRKRILSVWCSCANVMLFRYIYVREEALYNRNVYSLATACYTKAGSLLFSIRRTYVWIVCKYSSSCVCVSEQQQQKQHHIYSFLCVRVLCVQATAAAAT